MQCAETLRVQAYFDGEVDAVAALEIERHAEHCPECRALLEQLANTRARIRGELEFATAPPQLRAGISRLLDEEVRRGNPQRAPRVPLRPRPFWLGALGGMGAALAAALALFFLFPTLPNPVLDDLVTAHVRSLMPEHLIDVVSTDRHTVKPWFAGHADVSPVVADFADRGYRLVGGRADYFDQQRVAVVVYQHGAHVINVFSWVAGRRALPEFATRSGYHIACWKLGNLQYCAVSDTGWDELQGLVRLVRTSGELDTPH
ncbi:MAG TPA: zf-HC2 domain-containing protein [Steroidobacteraceae bacterium]